MKIFIRGAAAALALSLVGVTGAEAQLTAADNQHPGSLSDYYAGSLHAGTGSEFEGEANDCHEGDTPSQASECAGAFSGNDKGEAPPPQSEVESYIATTWGGTGSFLGDVTDSWMSLSGTFVLSLKSAGYFSLYYFADVGLLSDLGTGGVTDQELSHVGLYEVGDVSVPEPTTLFLLGTGLLGMSFLAWRRREEILA